MVNRKAARRRLVAVMARQGRTVDDMAAEVAGRERCGILAAYRLVHDLSQEGATDRYNELLGVHIGDSGFLSRQRIGKLEAWPHSTITPTLPELVNLARLYGTKPERLIRPDHLSKLPPSVRTALSHEAPAATNGRTLEPPTTRVTDEVDDMHRRALLLGAVGAGATVPLDKGELLRSALSRAAGVSDTVEDWQAVAAQYAVTVPTTAPDQLLRDVFADLAELSRLLDAGHPDRFSLLDVTAQLSAYAAMALSDLGRFRDMSHWWTTAGKTADASGRKSLSAWVRARHGMDLLYGPKLPGPTLQLADNAVKGLGGQPCIALAEAHCARAGALARQGNPAALDALEDLSRTFDKLPGEAVSDDVSWNAFGEWRVRSAQVSVNLMLRDAIAARRAVDRVLVLAHGRSQAVEARTQLSLAVCMVLDGDVTEGVEHAVTTIQQLPYAFFSARERGALVLDALPEKARALPAVAELRELVHC